MSRILVISTVVLIVFLSNPLIATGQVQIIEDAGIRSLMDRYIEINRQREDLDGWRIQITATTDRRKMESEKRSFENRFPEVDVYWEHTQPYYRLKAGAYPERYRALPDLHRIKKYFPQAYLVVDKIPFKEILEIN